MLPRLVLTNSKNDLKVKLKKKEKRN
jgi:hypothetical protein